MTARTTTMGNLKNIIGAGGEYLCGIELMRPVIASAFLPRGFLPAEGGCLFEALHFGGKEPTYDYVVYLLDATARRLGPFFFLQVKTTLKTPDITGAYAMRFSAAAVARAHAMKTPFFVGIVDRSTARREKIYVKGIDARQSKGIASLAPLHDLAEDAVKIAIYNEVCRVWALRNNPPLTQLI
ncbi:hypothetical protein [Herbaspirillum huttiense]|uniref:hypothetical protein n=1 Tax=Herbaspirillum huttiense TaxID=863372 RepID=UPI0039B0B693